MDPLGPKLEIGLVGEATRQRSAAVRTVVTTDFIGNFESEWVWERIKSETGGNPAECADDAIEVSWRLLDATAEQSPWMVPSC